MDKKKSILVLVVLAAIALTGGAATKCPWIKEHYQETIAPIVSGLW